MASRDQQDIDALAVPIMLICHLGPVTKTL